MRYSAFGGVVFVKEHAPVTIQKARMIETIHRMNAAYQLEQSDARSVRLKLAKTEQSLADEMANAIKQATEKNHDV